jgi:hypothetical protein
LTRINPVIDFGRFSGNVSLIRGITQLRNHAFSRPEGAMHRKTVPEFLILLSEDKTVISNKKEGIFSIINYIF